MGINGEWFVIVEPNELMRRGLVDLVSSSGNANCAAFDSIELMEKEFDTSIADAVVIVNFGSNVQNIAQRIARLKTNRPTFRIALLSDAYSHSHLQHAISAGAYGYLLTTMDCKTLFKSLEIISLGQPVIPEEALEFITSGHTKSSNEARVQSSNLPAELLSERELAVLRCISRAMSNKLIAREINVCEATVKVHVKAILRKINGKNRTEAAIWALEHGLEPIESAQEN